MSRRARTAPGRPLRSGRLRQRLQIAPHRLVVLASAIGKEGSKQSDSVTKWLSPGGRSTLEGCPRLLGLAELQLHTGKQISQHRVHGLVQAGGGE